MTGMGSGMGWMWIFGVLLLAGLVLVIVVVVRMVSGGIGSNVPAVSDSGPHRGRSRARELLDERYARGELTTEEYRERLTALEEGA